MPSLPQDENSMKQPLLNKSGTPQDNPPAYDYGAYNAASPKPVGAQQQSIIVNRMEAGPSSFVFQPSATPAPTVFNYVNPATGETVVSLLPPNHPEMICLQSGAHVPESHYGILGILAAIFWFPLGVACCLLDRQVRCRRCGVIIDNGVCD